jgi:ferredoxin
MLFSGDGARALTDLFCGAHGQAVCEVIYAEHFFMPNNISNVFFLRQRSGKSLAKITRRAERKMDKVCRDINAGKVRRRGFSVFSKLIGKIQGVPWQGDSRSPAPSEGTMEHRAKHSVKIGVDCTACGICAECCPMKNFENAQGVVTPKGNCTVCYRCINLCPQKAISVWFSKKPKWQYKRTHLRSK